jgi:hypothetical protein
VVTNFPGGPAEWTEFPIIDPTGIATYFGQGASIGKIWYQGKRQEIDTKLICPYYWDYSSFRSNFYRYLSYGPHARAFETFLVKQATRFPFQKFGLKDFIVMLPEVVVPKSSEELDAAARAQHQELRRLFDS